jgi:hypothetical protein
MYLLFIQKVKYVNKKKLNCFGKYIIFITKLLITFVTDIVNDGNFNDS